MGANAPLNGALVSSKNIEDMLAPNGVEDEGFHAGVDDPRGFSIEVWMVGEEEMGHWVLVQHEKFDGDGVRDGNRCSADAHS